MQWIWAKGNDYRVMIIPHEKCMANGSMVHHYRIFVELLLQLSLHALREVHRQTFPVDVASNPLSASLTDVSFSHAATLFPITKGRIALERRRFLKNAETAVQRQAKWSNLAHEKTAEFRGLCAEEQELEKLYDLRNKVKLDGELWDELVFSSSQNSHLVQRATCIWDSLLARKNHGSVEFLRNVPDGKYDAIIVDSSDPVGT
ncbi:unnamed protein product [Camellia sinensis]